MDNLGHYHEHGYVILEDAVPPEQLGETVAAYDALVERALEKGHAERDPDSGRLKGYRFQNPHHPAICDPAVAAALSPPTLMEFCRELIGEPLALHGVAAFFMEPYYDYRGDWHRDSYYAWGKDSETELAHRLKEQFPTTQALVSLLDDLCLWLIPGSHNRENTVEEEARFNHKRVGPDEMFPDAVRLEVKAGSVVPFDARAIHRGWKPADSAGPSRRSMFVVYGSVAALEDAVIGGWAADAAYADPQYQDTLPTEFRAALTETLGAVQADR